MHVEIKNNGFTYYYYPTQTFEEVTQVFDMIFGCPEVDTPESD